MAPGAINVYATGALWVLYSPAMSYRVRLWCRDCTGEDPQGCFDGGSELLESPLGVVADYGTEEEAEAAGRQAVRNCGPWEYEVVTDSGEDGLE
jgi:hypothetical protein